MLAQTIQISPFSATRAPQLCVQGVLWELLQSRREVADGAAALSPHTCGFRGKHRGARSRLECLSPTAALPTTHCPLLVGTP